MQEKKSVFNRVLTFCLLLFQLQLQFFFLAELNVMVTISLNLVLSKNVVHLALCVLNSEIYRNIDVLENGYPSLQLVNGATEGGSTPDGDGGLSCWPDQDVALNHWEEYLGRSTTEINNYG